MSKKILFLHGDSFCYDSAACFIKCISREFERLGWQTDHVFCPEEKAAEALIPFYGKSYDILFSMNLALPCLRDEEGVFCLNHIKGEVWHYILDHPFYHHNTLKCPLEDFHVICLDEKHQAFIQKHYPHIKQVICLPLAAEQADELIPYPKRRHEVLFTGTYTDSDLLLYQMTKRPAEQRRLFEQTVQLLLDEPKLTQEEAVVRFAGDEKLPERLKENYLMDMYLRACLREELLVQMLKREIPITVYGHNWEEFLAKCEKRVPNARQHLQMMGEVPYESLPAIYADTKIALNQLPWFKAGMHDRIPLALMNGCVCVTDESSYLENRFLDGEELYFYSLEDMEGAAELVGSLLEEPVAAAKTAARGYQRALKSLCWKQWVEEYCSLLS
jgi:hypothetical protein